MATVLPFTPSWFKMKKYFRSKNYFQSAVEELIAESPVGSGTRNIKVQAFDPGFLGKPRVVLGGTVDTATHKEGALRIVRDHSRNTVEIVDEISIGGGAGSAGG